MSTAGAAAFQALAIIPVYNHPNTVGAVVEGVLRAGLPCLLVDDGSDAACAAVLDDLAARHSGALVPGERVPQVQVLRLPRNVGKGGAVQAGLRQALQQGFTHALQIDADGQHQTGDILEFIAQARQHPAAMICGAPIYDASVPKVRFYGRYITHIWVWINTLSLDIEDSMCGFRVYPLSSAVQVLEGASVGQRMDFDTEILVRLHWMGVPFVTLRTKVNYPEDGVSHFHGFRDNVLISCMHAKLFFGMLARSPWLLSRKFRRRCTGGAT